MDLYEHQGKQLFREAGLPVLAGDLASSAAEARRIAERGSLPLVVKAQVLSGGRGKAGGVVVVTTAGDCEAQAERILGLTVKGKPVNGLLLEPAVAIAREFYLAIILSRRDRCPLLLFSTRGGMDIEQVASETPEALLRLAIDPLAGIGDEQVAAVVAAAGLPDGEPARLAGDDAPARAGDAPAAQLAAVVRGLWELYRERDATLVEVNPLTLLEDGRLICLDSKVTVDDNALFRQPRVAEWRAPGDEREVRAREAGVSYLSLDGDVGVLGNGAGMVMSTLDMIGAAGGAAADFCDVGGGAQAAAIAGALGVILGDERVNAVLVSIFGGITRGEEVARGLIAALGGEESRDGSSGEATDAGTSLQKVAGRPPVVVRLEGNGAGEGRALLAAAALPGVETVADADEAVARAVALARDRTAGGGR